MCPGIILFIPILLFQDPFDCPRLIRYKATETFLIIVFSDREIIGEIVKESKNENCIEGTETQAAMREVLIKYPNADSIIIAHNHPHHIVAEPSEEDTVRTLHTRIASPLPHSSLP